MLNRPKSSLPVAGSSITSARNVSPPAEGQVLNARSATRDDRSVGNKIKKLRREAGRTQKELAELVGVTGAQFHRYEVGTTRVAASRLMSIAAALGVRAEALISGASEPGMPHASPSLSSEASNDLVELVEAYSSIADPRRRQALISFARALAGKDSANEAESRDDP